MYWLHTNQLGNEARWWKYYAINNENKKTRRIRSRNHCHHHDSGIVSHPQIQLQLFERTKTIIVDSYEPTPYILYWNQFTFSLLLLLRLRCSSHHQLSINATTSKGDVKQGYLYFCQVFPPSTFLHFVLLLSFISLLIFFSFWSSPVHTTNRTEHQQRLDYHPASLSTHNAIIIFILIIIKTYLD